MCDVTLTDMHAHESQTRWRLEQHCKLMHNTVLASRMIQSRHTVSLNYYGITNSNNKNMNFNFGFTSSQLTLYFGLRPWLVAHLVQPLRQHWLSPIWVSHNLISLSRHARMHSKLWGLLYRWLVTMRSRSVTRNEEHQRVKCFALPFSLTEVKCL